MEEKKKRVRATWRQVRELEDVVERQCKELRDWREKYNELEEELKKVPPTLDASKDIALEAQRKEIARLEDSLRKLKREYAESIKIIEQREESVQLREAELQRRESRGFFARLFGI